MAAQEEHTMEKIIALSKRRGFVFQGSEIYGGLRGTWDYGPLGVMLANNLKREWWKFFVESREDMYGLDAAIIMNPQVWQASGHTGAGFTDPVVVCKECGNRERGDHVKFVKDEAGKIIGERWICAKCGTENDFEPMDFNLMFETFVGPTAKGPVKGEDGKLIINSDTGNPIMVYDPDSVSYLRPETAQGIFVNFKNVVDTMSPKLPFGIAQIGKAFRNEIAPREWLFRTREFQQLEIEYFLREGEWEAQFEAWREAMWAFFDHLGLSREHVREHEVPAEDLAHYSKRTIDFEYDYPGKGFDELAGFAYRTDHDLKSHMEASGVSLKYTPADGEPFVPHVLEPSFGLERLMMAVMSEAYTEDEMGESSRTFLRLPIHLAPFRVAVSPLLKNKPELVGKAREVFTMLKKEFGNVAWDDNGNIGKRYRRQDEIGTPSCIVIDFETLGESGPEQQDTVTVRDRDTGEQVRVKTDELVPYFKKE